MRILLNFLLLVACFFFGLLPFQGCGEECQTDKDCIAKFSPEHICRIGENRAKSCIKRESKVKTCEPVCKSGETCEDGTCKAPVKKGCQPACQEGESCKDQKCTPDKKDTCEPACHEAFQCVKGKCVLKGAALCSPSCREGYECVGKKCVEKKCDPVCKSEFICKLGKCIPKPKCQKDTECGQGKRCINGQCLDRTTCSSDQDCPTQKTCYNKQCLDRPTCADGCRKCRLGFCEDQSNTVYSQCSGTRRCSAGEACVNFSGKTSNSLYCLKRCALRFGGCPKGDRCVSGTSGKGFCRPIGTLRDSVVCSYDKPGPKIDKNQLCEDGYTCIPLPQSARVCKLLKDGDCASNQGLCPKGMGCVNFRRGTQSMSVCFIKCINDKCPSTLTNLYCKTYSGVKYCYPK